MQVTEQFKSDIAPFIWVELKSGASVCLTAGGYLQEVFDSRAEEGFIGNGYDWGSLAQIFLDEKCPELQEKDALADFILGFKKACDDKELILDLFSRAELD